MSTLLETLNKKVLNAQEEAIHIQKNLAKEAQKIRSQDKERAILEAPNVIKTLIKDLKKAADNGKKYFTFYIINDGSNKQLSTYHSCLQEEIITYLKNNNIQVEKQYSYKDPSGSDDYYGCTVYSWWLNISW